METLSDANKKYGHLSKEQLLEELVSLRSKIQTLQSQLFAKRPVRFQADPEGQSPLFDEVEVEASSSDSSSDAAIAVEPHTRKKRGKRSPLPKDLPRERVEFDLSEKDKLCPVHNVQMDRIGEKVSEKLDIVPAQVKIREEVTFSYKCRCCSESADKDSIISSSKEPTIVPKGIATPGLLAYIAVAKYLDALPLYRQEKIFSRHGIQINRTSMARWMIQCAEAAIPLINLMKDDLLSRSVIGCDETPIQVLKENDRQPQQKSYMWVATSFAYGPIVLFQYRTGRCTKTAADVLDGYKGTVVCDGLKTYNSLARTQEIILAGCLAHILRKFRLAHRALKKVNPKGKPRSSKPIALIKELYDIEKELRGKPPARVIEVRQEKSVPLIEEFNKWLDDHVGHVLPKSLIGKAINYAIDQRSKMSVFLENPLVPIDNNLTESAIRPFVVGRKNWLFADTENGADASSTLYSLTESARANGLDPFEYLSYIFKELPKAKTEEDYGRLLPYRASQFHNFQSSSTSTGLPVQG